MEVSIVGCSMCHLQVNRSVLVDIYVQVSYFAEMERATVFVPICSVNLLESPACYEEAQQVYDSWPNRFLFFWFIHCLIYRRHISRRSLSSVWCRTYPIGTHSAPSCRRSWSCCMSLSSCRDMSPSLTYVCIDVGRKWVGSTCVCPTNQDVGSIVVYVLVCFHLC